MKYLILGSCVTRDVFRVAKPSTSLEYQARSSLISIMSHPLKKNIDESSIKLDSNFQKQMVLKDVNKNFFERLHSIDFDFILLDFTDERFDLFRIGDSYVTRSVELLKSGFITQFEDYEHVKRFVETTHLLWERACKSFVKELLKVVPPHKIILHEAYWSMQYVNNNELIQFPNNQLAMIKNVNNMLNRYHTFVKAQASGIHVVSHEGLADQTHIWGLSPCHYTKDYYKSIYKQFESISN